MLPIEIEKFLNWFYLNVSENWYFTRPGYSGDAATANKTLNSHDTATGVH